MNTYNNYKKHKENTYKPITSISILLAAYMQSRITPWTDIFFWLRNDAAAAAAASFPKMYLQYCPYKNLLKTI